jgi:dTDP-D-glucose 4,6-dehydratase
MGQGSVEFVKDPRPYNDSRYCIDSSELRNLGWSETMNFDSKLRETIDWYKANPNWYKLFE